MTVKELIEMLETCDKESIVYINCGDDINSIDEICDYGQAACVKPENFDLNVGSNYARIKAEDKIWEGLGFVLQWAKYGLKK